MKYEITFMRRGDVTDSQKEDLLRKLKLKLLKEKEKGRAGTWIVKGPNGLKDADLAKALRRFKISKEMSKATVSEL